MPETLTQTAKLLVFYSQPDDPAEFERLYFETHVPLAKKMPGLQDISVSKLTKNMMGGELPYYMMAEMTFASKDDLKAAMKSPEGQAAGENIMGFAAKLVTMIQADTLESVRF